MYLVVRRYSVLVIRLWAQLRRVACQSGASKKGTYKQRWAILNIGIWDPKVVIKPSAMASIKSCCRCESVSELVFVVLYPISQVILKIS